MTTEQIRNIAIDLNETIGSDDARWLADANIHDVNPDTKLFWTAIRDELVKLPLIG
jgi:hypothetical protein